MNSMKGFPLEAPPQIAFCQKFIVTQMLAAGHSFLVVLPHRCGINFRRNKNCRPSTSPILRPRTENPRVVFPLV
jgi:hypothetical protein